MTLSNVNCCVTSIYDVTNTLTDSPEVAVSQSPGSMLLVVAHGFVLALSVVGNSIVLCVIKRHLGYRTPTNVYITALGVADVGSSLVCLSLAVATITATRWPHGSTATCVGFDVMRRSLSLASTSMTSLLVVDRYMTVVRLHRVQSVTVKTMLTVAFLVVMSLVTSLPWYAPAGADDASNSSTFWPPVCFWSAAIYDTVYTGLTSGLPAAALACCSARLVCAIVRSSNTVRPSTSAAGQLLFHDEMQTATTVILLVVVFVVCRSVQCLLVGLAAASSTDRSGSLHHSRVVLDSAASMFVAVSGAINPVVYAVRNPNVARVFHVGRRQRYGGYVADDAASTPGAQTTVTTDRELPANGGTSTDSTVVATASHDGDMADCNIVDTRRKSSDGPASVDVFRPPARAPVNFLTSRRTSSSFSIVYITSRRRSSQVSDRTTSTLASVVV